ncbi:hypothetical protein [Nonomuraea sp. NPDC003804]|uniref:hypothetical protein n=1 Tax=Nonomuraea sp. NPDC003804 TaxID=3154547 RepID=UPI0033B7BFA7
MINFKRALAVSAIAASALAVPVTLAGSPAGATTSKAGVQSVTTDATSHPCTRRHSDEGRPCGKHETVKPPDDPALPACARPENQTHNSDPCNPGPIGNTDPGGTNDQLSDCARPENQTHNSDPCNPGPVGN